MEWQLRILDTRITQDLLIDELRTLLQAAGSLEMRLRLDLTSLGMSPKSPADERLDAKWQDLVDYAAALARELRPWLEILARPERQLALAGASSHWQQHNMGSPFAANWPHNGPKFSDPPSLRRSIASRFC